MIRKLILLGSVLILWSACGTDSTGTGGQSTSDSATTGYQGGPGSVVGPPMIPPQNEITTKLLTDFWVFEYYVVPGDQAASRAGMGRWYKFHPDGTFESGRWEDEIWGSGNWYFVRKDNKNYLRLDSTVDTEDAEWEIQGVTDSAMSWSGTSTYADHNGGVILKALSLMTIPTRAQFNFSD